MVAHTCNPRTLGGRGGRITGSGARDLSGQCGETPSLLKIQKLARHGGARLLLEWLRSEDHLNPGGEGCSRDCCHCTPAWATEQARLCLKKEINKIKLSRLQLCLFPTSAVFGQESHIPREIMKN